MKRTSGMTLVETLVALGILTLVTGIITTFLTAQWRLADQTEARNEMQVNLRSALEMISADLNIAGSQGVEAACNVGDVTPALWVNTSRPYYNVKRRHTLFIRYCDTYARPETTPEDRSVEVAYELRKDTENDNVWALYRRERKGADSGARYDSAVPGVRAFELSFTCTPDAPTCNATDSLFDPSDVLSVTVKLTAQSVHKTRGVSSPFMFDGNRVTNQEEAGYYYEYAEQTVSPPNLRP